VSETDALRALMEADRWVDRVSAQRNHLSEMAELSTLEDELRALSKALQEARGAQAPVQQAYEDAANEAERIRRREHDLDATLAASTGNARELGVLQRELEHLRDLLGRAEDRELELLIEIEPLDEVVAAIKARAQPGVARRAQLQATILELQATLDEEIASLRLARAERARALSPELLARYDNVMVRVGTTGAAQVNAGRCDGCRIVLAPLDVDRWKSQPAGTFMSCPECGRLLLP
jgi:predicted  nucleic acid-binding Zn-ribbon protein